MQAEAGSNPLNSTGWWQQDIDPVSLTPDAPDRAGPAIMTEVP